MREGGGVLRDDSPPGGESVKRPVSGPQKAADAGAFVLLTGLGALVAVVQGLDNNWDFRAYHLYNGWALVNDRLEADIAPAGAHSFFNPTLDAASYLLLSISPLWGTAALGAWFGFGMYLLYAVALRILPGQPVVARTTALISALFAGAGALTVSMAGTTMNETQMVPFLAGALLAAHKALDGRRRRVEAWALCGALLAVAVGLKFTAASYAVGPLLVIGGWMLAKRDLRALLGLALGTTGGFLVSYGWWGWTLLREFSSPVFPLYNGIFQSPYAATRNVDLVQMPHSLGEALAAPVQWSLGNPVMAETGAYFQDPRILLGGVAALAYIVGPSVSLWRPHPLLRGLGACFLAAFFVWALVFRVARYTAGLEVLGAFLFVAAVATVVRAAAVRRPLAPVLATLLVLATSAALTSYPAWGRTTLDVEVDQAGPPLAIPSGALVLLIDRPANSNQLPALIPTLGEDKVYVQPAGMLINPGDGTLLSQRVGGAVSKAEDIRRPVLP